MLAGYRKALVAAVPALLAGVKVLADALGSGQVTGVEWCAVAVAVLGALGVFAVPNAPAVVAPAPPTILTAPPPPDGRPSA